MKKTTRILLWLLFGLNMLLALWLLVIGRLGSSGLWKGVSDYWQEVRQRISLLPLHTVREQLGMLFRGPQTIGLYNLLGNLFLLFLPGLVLPCLLPRLRKPGWLLLAAFLFVLTAEIAQLFLLIGVFDTDDFLLNLLGALLGYACFRLPPVQRRLHITRHS